MADVLPFFMPLAGCIVTLSFCGFLATCRMSIRLHELAGRIQTLESRPLTPYMPPFPITYGTGQVQSVVPPYPPQPPPPSAPLAQSNDPSEYV